MKKHAIRIVGGDYRKTPIAVVDAPGLRPTPDRVRETLFNWLRHFWMSDFHDKRVLDLFAGSGALGFEAASHGAGEVHLVECHPAALAALHRVRAKLRADTVHIHAGQAMSCLKRLGGGFDLICLDPPFGQNLLPTLWGPVRAALRPEGLVYAESESAFDVPDQYEVLRQARAGHVHFCLLQAASLQKADNHFSIS